MEAKKKIQMIQEYGKWELDIPFALFFLQMLLSRKFGRNMLICALQEAGTKEEVDVQEWP